jgi:hypothetical protein
MLNVIPTSTLFLKVKALADVLTLHIHWGLNSYYCSEQRSSEIILLLNSFMTIRFTMASSMQRIKCPYSARPALKG